jgi:uncharacterized membrane protein YfcA
MDLDHFNIDWQMLSTIAVISGLGIFGGVSLGKRIAGPTLRSAFGWFVMLIGIVILFSEILSLVAKQHGTAVR